MSAGAQSPGHSVAESLETYSRDAVRSAIEAALDPSTGAEMSRHLEELIDNDSFENFSAIGLCVALGEAKADAAIPLLLKTATRDDVDLDELAEAAKYALRRMGMPAFEAAMQFIASEPDHWPKVAAYDILCAAATCDDHVRRCVADFCIDRAHVEINRNWEQDEWHPGHSACEVLLWLRDPRLEPLLEEALGRTDDPQYGTMLEEFKQVEPDLDNVDWRIEWPDQCRHWASLLTAAQSLAADRPSPGPGNGYEDLLEDFANAPFVTALPCGPDVAAGQIRAFIDLATTYVNEDFSFDNIADVREMLLEWLPRKVSAEAEYFERFPDVLEAFAHFLKATGQLDDAQPLLSLVAEARTELPRLASDPANWGMAKRLFMHGGLTDLPPDHATFDLDSITRRIARAMDLELDTELREQPPAGVEPTKPIRRDTPKVGRNDPCPCGSGKKFKKCCGG